MKYYYFIVIIPSSPAHALNPTAAPTLSPTTHTPDPTLSPTPITTSTTNNSTYNWSCTARPGAPPVPPNSTESPVPLTGPTHATPRPTEAPSPGTTYTPTQLEPIATYVSLYLCRFIFYFFVICELFV